MRLRVVAGAPARRPRLERLAADLAAPTSADLSGAVRRAVALVEQELDDMPNMLTMRELAETPAGDLHEPVITIVDQDGKTMTRLRTVAAHFEDTVTFFPTLDEWEVWQLINLSGDTHPIHIHLSPFHILSRRAITVTIPDDGIADRETTATVGLTRDPGDPLGHLVEANEQGPQGHRPGQPQRDRRTRDPLPDLQRPLHVPLPHPRTRGPRHDAPDRRHARAAHALHELSPWGACDGIPEQACPDAPNYFALNLEGRP